MEKKSSLERLEKKLGQRELGSTSRRSELSRRRSASGTWKQEERPRPRRRGPGALELFFVASIVFFVVAGLFAAYLFFSGTNTVSTRNVTIAIDGPTEIRAGDTLPLQVVITNRNSVPMELVDLVVEFPKGTRSEADVTVELPRIRESLGTIDSGESVNRTIRAVVFGQSGATLDIDVSVEYRVPSSNAIFVSEGSYTLPISQSPASITVESLKETVSGQETALTVTVSSNVEDVLGDILLIAEYPPGFAFMSATPAPLSGSDTWRLGDIEPGGQRTVTIRGTFTGEDGDEKVVHFTAGSQNGSAGEIAAPLAAGDASLVVAKPFVSLQLSLDGSVATEKVVQRGSSIRADVRWVNNLPSRAQDVEIEVRLDGAILDRTSVVAQRGFWRSANNTIVFSRESDPALADVAPGASGVYSFTFETLSESQGTFRNPEIGINATVRARRIAENNVPESIESSTEARILVATDLVLQSVAAHLAGPRPPKADQESSYVVSWSVTNNANAVAGVSVSAVLPSYVRFIASGEGNLSYNPIGGVVTWTIGDLEASASRTATFQIGVTPSLSHVGQAPTIVSDQRVYGFDRFVRTQIERIAPSLNTKSGLPLTSTEGNVVP